MTEENTPTNFAAKEIIIAEYQYIAQTAFQANEDRARVTTFYLVSVGSLVGALIGTTSTTSTITLWAFAGLFLFLSLFGLLTLHQLIRLRRAWFESIEAMNKIKDFIIKTTTDIPLKEAFLWKTSSIPPSYKPGSVAFLLALQVTMLGTVTFSASIYYVGLALNYLLPLGAAIGGILFLIFQLYIYRSLLK